MTKSLCPECLKTIDATIYEEENKVYIAKECTEHGFFKDVYWSDINEYKRAQKYAVIGEGIDNPQTKTIHGHPLDCGICPKHKSHTSLAIIDVTNRCNMHCPICFANAAVTGYVYEPTKKQILKMLNNIKEIKPFSATALQFSGGEPTIREDLLELVQMAKTTGFDHVEVNSNGIKMADSVDYCRSLLDAGVSTIYLQFDGVTPEVYTKTRGQDIFDTKLKAIDNCRKAGLDSVVLVPTVVKGVNDDQLGDIINFAAKRFDVVRGVNFQPVSITGRIEHEKRKAMRITIPDCMRLIEEQTGGMIKTSDFYPVPTIAPISRAIGALKQRNFVEFTVHEHCGMATFILIENNKLVPITRYVNVDKFMDSMSEVHEKVLKGYKTRAKVQMISSTLKHVKYSLLKPLAEAVISKASYESLGKFMRQILMIGMMHFQDPYNFDLERLERCGIHYAVPDGRIIPFCAMNTLYRTKIEKEFGTPTRDWIRRNT